MKALLNSIMMKKLACGVDLVHIKQVQSDILKLGNSYLKRAFTIDEIAYCDVKLNKYQHYAARIAAKEAVFKALGMGWNKGLQWKHIEVTHLEQGNPYLKLHGNIPSILEEKGFTIHDLSISHSADFAMAMVVFM